MSETGRLLERWFAVWNSHELDRLRAMVTTDYVHHTMGGADLDIVGFDAGLRGLLTAFPDLRYEVVHVVEQSPFGAVALQAIGTHRASYLGIAATGRTVTFRGMYHCRVEDDRIAEDWDVFDLLTPALHLGATIAADRL
jgi:steroid delta-isomerase-like uncharacterized protein